MSPHGKAKIDLFTLPSVVSIRLIGKKATEQCVEKKGSNLTLFAIDSIKSFVG